MNHGGGVHAKYGHDHHCIEGRDGCAPTVFFCLSRWRRHLSSSSELCPDVDKRPVAAKP